MRSHSPVVGWSRPSPARRRLRTLKSLLGTIAAAMATFLLLPMVVQAAPADELFVQPGGRVGCEFTGDTVYPGDSAYCILRVGSNFSVDADVYLFVDPDSVSVVDADDVPVDDEIAAATFASLWMLSAWTKPIATRSAPEDRDVGYLDRFERSCPRGLFAAYDGRPEKGDVVARTCSLGMIRGISGPRPFADSGDPVYQRLYRVEIHRIADQQTDHSRFAGWGLRFDMVVRAKVPASDPCPTPRVGSVCTSPAYVRP